jgi:hypothetical protein
MNMADADLLERHSRHLPHAILIVDNEHFKSCCDWHVHHSSLKPTAELWRGSLNS